MTTTAAARAETGAALAVENVSKSYGTLKALDNVSVHVSRGQFVALLGPNGAGKTTLFQLLSGLFVADAGRIHVTSRDFGRESVACLAKLGVVFQQATLDLDMSVRANLLFHARLHGMGRRAASRIREELNQVGLTDNEHDICRKLSGGNRRKVELARSLLHGPQVLLLDEPTVGLDPASRRSLLDYVHALCTTRGLGVLWATHLVDEAEGADNVLILHRGHLLAEGSPAELVQNAQERNLAEAFLKLTS